MAKIEIKGAATLTWAHELVDDKDGGGFYLKVFPKLTRFRVYRDSTQMHRIAREVIEEMKATKLTGKTRIKK